MSARACGRFGAWPLALLLASAGAVQAQGVNGAISSPGPNATVMQPFAITGWALHGPGAGTGIDAVHIYGCTTVCTFWGAATYGLARPDVSAVYGAQYLNTGYSFTKTGLTPGSYYLQVHAHSTINGAWYQWGHFLTVQAGPEHTLELPTQLASLTSPVAVQGWAIDASAPSGTGVTQINLWTHPNVGSGQVAILLGQATYGANRADVAASHGERFRYSGYTASLATLAAGPHYFAATAYSPHSNVWTYQWRSFYVDTPTVPLTIDRPGTGTGGVTATGLTCVGGIDDAGGAVRGELSAAHGGDADRGAGRQLDVCGLGWVVYRHRDVPGHAVDSALRGGDLHEAAGHGGAAVLPRGSGRLRPRDHGRGWRRGGAARLPAVRRGRGAPHRRPEPLRRQAARPGERAALLRRALLPADVGTLHAGGPRARRGGDERTAAMESIRICRK